MGWGWDLIHPRTAEVVCLCLLIMGSLPLPISYSQFVFIWSHGCIFLSHLSGEIWALHLAMFSSHWTLTPLEKTRGKKRGNRIKHGEPESPWRQSTDSWSPGAGGRGLRRDSSRGRGSRLGTRTSWKQTDVLVVQLSQCTKRSWMAPWEKGSLYVKIYEFYACF